MVFGGGLMLTSTAAGSRTSRTSSLSGWNDISHPSGLSSGEKVTFSMADVPTLVTSMPNILSRPAVARVLKRLFSFEGATLRMPRGVILAVRSIVPTTSSEDTTTVIVYSPGRASGQLGPLTVNLRFFVVGPGFLSTEMDEILCE